MNASWAKSETQTTDVEVYIPECDRLLHYGSEHAIYTAEETGLKPASQQKIQVISLVKGHSELFKEVKVPPPS